MALVIRHKDRFGRKNSTGGAGSPQSWDADHEIDGQFPMALVQGLADTLAQQTEATTQARVAAIEAAAANKATTPQARDGSDNSAFLTSETGKVSVLTHARNALLTDMLPFPGYIARSVLRKLGDWVSVLDFEAVLDGVTDCTAAFNYALAVGQVVEVPIGVAYLTDAILVRKGQRLIGKGRTKTILKIGGDFNMAALGVVRFEAGEPGSWIKDIGFTAVQPANPASRADIVQYPPAIYAQGCPRFRIESVRIEQHFRGIDARGNCGGANIDDLEIGCYGVDVEFDGSFDSVRLTRLHHWPFGGMTSAAQRAIYSDSEHYGLKIGRVDDLHINQWIGFSIPNAMYFWNGAAGGGSFSSIVGADFDDRGGLCVDGTSVRMRVVGPFFSMGKTDSQYIRLSAGFVVVAGGVFEAAINTTTLPMVEISAGSLLLAGSRISHSAANAPWLKVTASGVRALVSGATLSLTVDTVYNQPILDMADATGGLFSLLLLNARTTGSAAIVSNTRSDANFAVSGVMQNGWSIGALGVAATQLRSAGASSVTSGGTVRAASTSPTAANSGAGGFRIATGTGAAADESLIVGVEDAVAAWIQAIKPGTLVRPLKLNPLGGDVLLGSALAKTGFFGAAGAGKPTITGSRSDGSALADLLSKLAGLGLLSDGTSA